MAAIQTSGLTKRFGNLYAVDGVDLVVEEGEVFGFLGPNGAGKSTTINILLDFVRPTSGSVSVFGLDAQSETTAIHERLGVLPEGYDLYERLTGREHVELALDLKDADEDPDALVDRVGLTPSDARRKAGEYSHGMGQRLALAMALAGDPDLLILDEPTSGLDPNGARELREIVREHAQQGKTVFFSSHILEQVEAVCDRVAILYQGRVVAQDTIDGLRKELGSGERITLTVNRVPEGIAEKLGTLQGVASVGTEPGFVYVSCTDPTVKIDVIDDIRNAGAKIVDINTSKASLEELFAAYTGQGEEVVV